MLTMQEVEPLALCMATQNLFDRRFRSNFGDTILLKDRDPSLERDFLRIKREMSSSMTTGKFVNGHKMNILFNMDKILFLLPRFKNVDMSKVDLISSNIKDLMKKVVEASSFDDISEMEAMFKSQVTLPVYELYVRKSKGDRFK